MMTNLLKETIEIIERNERYESDVLWVGRGFDDFSKQKYKSTWEDFKSKADFNYDSGFGGNEIPTDLIVVGNDFWLERHEYDGSEWWEFKTMPKEPEETMELSLDPYDNR